MLIIEQELLNLSEAKYFANFDMSQAYWQLRLHGDSQECQSLITPDGLLSPTRVLHGTTNAVTHFQSSLHEAMLNELLNNILCRLDDILVYAKDPEDVLCTMEMFFRFCKAFNLKLNPEKANCLRQ